MSKKDWEQLAIDTGVAPKPPKSKPSPERMPPCNCGRYVNGRPVKVEKDGFGRPTDKCKLCRLAAVTKMEHT